MTHATWLSPIPGLIRRDPGHRYWLNDRPFPTSVTGVLRIQKSDFAMDRIMSTAAIWAPRGNTTHRALELFLTLQFAPSLNSGDRSPEFQTLGDELLSLRSGDYTDWIEPLLAHDHWNQVTVIASERPTCCLTRCVAGTFDLAYVAANRRVLADLKTIGTADSHTYCTRAQLGGYMALEATHGNHYDYGQTIWAKPGQASFSTLYSRRECLLAWAAVWTRYQAVHRLV